MTEPEELNLAQGRDRHSPWAYVAVISLAIVLSCLPFFRVIFSSDQSAMFNSIASDTYYYLRVAEGYLAQGITSFDGETATNGYNPAWQIVVIIAAMLTGASGAEPMLLLGTVFYLCIALVAAGSTILSVVLLRAFGWRVAVLMNFVLTPGVFFYLFDQSYKRVGDPGILYGFSNWSFVNGMESGLGFMFWAVAVAMLFLFFRSPERTDRFFFLLGAMTFLIAFTRLDDVFFGISVFIGIAPWLVANRRFRAVIAFGLVPVFGFAIYVWFNHNHFGSALPISGVSKTNLFAFPTRPSLLLKIGELQFHAQRLLPMCGLLGFGIVTLVALLVARKRGGVCGIMLVLAWYLVLKYFFLFSSVRPFDQGFWYYTLGIASFNLIVALLLLEVIRKLTGVAFAGSVVFTAFAAIVTALHFDSRLHYFPDDAYTRVWHHLCTNGPELRGKIMKAAAETSLGYKGIDTGDGAVAYCLDMPSISISGLVDSPEVAAKRAAKGNLATGFDRGYRIVVQNEAQWGTYLQADDVADEGFLLRPIFTDGVITANALEPATTGTSQ